MKLYQRFFIALAALAVGAMGFANRANAQFGVQPIWANYSVQYVNEFYNPLAGSTLIPVTSFFNFSGAPDPDDGTATHIPVGFPFEFNGNMSGVMTGNVSGQLNVNINGWVTVRSNDSNATFNAIPVTPANNNNLFSSVLPNNTLAPYWGDHYYRTVEPGYTPTRISYATTYVPAATVDPNSKAFAQIGTFVLEWRNLNINDKTNPNSIASFQLIIRQNPKAYDLAAPDERATIEFQYGPIGNNSTVTTVGDAVGAEDSAGFTHINALFATAVAYDSVRNNTTARTTCWPPATCLPGRAIQLVPNGVGLLNQWGDGDVLLLQQNSPNPQVRANQSLFVTLADAMAILNASSTGIPLDSIEGRAAFHGDANHDGRVYNPTYGAFFYHTTPYDAAYIMMYLAGKLAELPWPMPLPVPGYKEANIHTTNVSGVIADATNIQTNGSTVLVPITIRGEVNGPLSVEMDLAGLASSGLEFTGTRAPAGTIMASNAATGRVVLATSGSFEDGATVGYLEFHAPANTNASFDLTNVKVNDADMAGSHVALKLGSADVVNGANGAMSSLDQNVPNPFMVSNSGETTIGFELATPENVTLRVYDLLGHEVRTLVAGEGRAAGHNTVQWDGRDASGNVVSSGLYYYQLVTPDFTKTAKMQVVR